jgi:hypothetical protein
MPLILEGFRAGWARILRIPRSIGADLQRLITTWGKALQFSEDVPTAPFRIGNQKGG